MTHVTEKSLAVWKTLSKLVAASHLSAGTGFFGSTDKAVADTRRCFDEVFDAALCTACSVKLLFLLFEVVVAETVGFDTKLFAVVLNPFEAFLLFFTTCRQKKRKTEQHQNA